MRRLAIVAMMAGLALAPLSAQPAEVEASAHQMARADFPERVGAFHRARVIQYDAEGLDMSASYDLRGPGGRIAASVYIYPAPPIDGDKTAARAEACRDKFVEAEQQIVKHGGSVERLADEAPIAVDAVPPTLRHRATFRFATAFDGSERTVRSELHLYCYVADRWLVKLRVTAPEAIPMAEAIENLVRHGPWPGRRAGTIAGVPDRHRAAGA